MFNLDALKRDWKDLPSYDRFEQIVTRIIMAFVSLVIVYSLGLVAIELFNDLRTGTDFLEKELLQDTFGSILTVLILLEFNHSIALALTKRSGVLQVRIVILIAVLVIMRKLILLDYKTATLEQLAGFGAVALALGGVYWLIGNGEHRHSGKEP